AARAFARIGAEDQVIALVRDPDARVVAAAVEGAAADTTEIYRSLLHQALSHPDVIVRTNVLGYLARAADPARAGLVLQAYQRAQRDTLNDAALAALDALRPLRPRLAELPRAFLEAFPRSADYLVRQRVAEVFGDTAAVAWGPALPIDTGRELEDYRRLVSRRGARRAVIETNRGEIEVELFAADAPLTVENFLSLAGRGFFDGQEWPRVVPNFVVQGGDPRGDTSGGPGYAIRDEINRHPYLRGTLGMALSGPDTGGSQWFVTHSPQPHLDGGYTVFGRVTRGMEVADRILPGDTIVRIREVR
ncbi:MAG TPA: peptidylprolyl isomerase, partial [Longimicrobium sp.]|nr:peptidylprolyl isomerase [Longimicrobium sp.]